MKKNILSMMAFLGGMLLFCSFSYYHEEKPLYSATDSFKQKSILVGTIGDDYVTLHVSFEDPQTGGGPLRGDIVSISATSDFWGVVNVLGYTGEVWETIFGDYVIYGHVVTDQAVFWFTDGTDILTME